MDDPTERRAIERRREDRERDKYINELRIRMQSMEEKFDKYSSAVEPGRLHRCADYLDEIRERDRSRHKYWASIWKTVISSMIIAVLSGMGALLVMGLILWYREHVAVSGSAGAAGVMGSNTSGLHTFMSEHWRRARWPVLITIISAPSFVLMFWIIMNALAPPIQEVGNRDVLTPNVCAGESARVTLPIVKLRECPTHVSRAWSCARSGVHLIAGGPLAASVGSDAPNVRNIQTPLIDWEAIGGVSDYCSLRTEVKATCNPIPVTISVPDVLVQIKKC